MPSRWSEQPWKVAYIAGILPTKTLLSVAKISASALFQGLRPNPSWPFAKSAGVLFVKDVFLQHLCAIRPAAPLSLEPGPEGERFDIIPEAKSNQITGIADDDQIRPVNTGGTWTPSPVEPSPARSQPDLLVALHFHGGAYVMCEGRDADSGFIAKNLLQNTPCSHVFMPQYRLSNNPGGRFPAALQDAIAAYSHLLDDVGIPASNIVLSGDSAGGNLALALLRYISEHGSQTGLPWPKSVLLWSPWVDVAAALDEINVQSSRNYSTDYVHSSFLNWGAEVFTALGEVSAENPYVSPIRKPFRVEVPVWVQAGEKEVFYEDTVKFSNGLKASGTEVEVYIEQNAPHDVIMMGERIGFTEEAKKCAVEAGEFLKKLSV